MSILTEERERQKRLMEERERRWKADCRIIQEGISDEAMEVLIRRCGADLPAFQLNEEGKPLTCDTQGLILRAALRDGAREVILKIQRMKKAKV